MARIYMYVRAHNVKKRVPSKDLSVCNIPARNIEEKHTEIHLSPAQSGGVYSPWR
jgi:hypothetical protein